MYFETRKNYLQKVFLGVALAGTIALAPTTAVAFEPISTLVVSVGTSLVVKGMNWLFGKAVESPNLHFEETQQIHSELREVHRDVLENRKLQIQISDLERKDHAETRETILEIEERLKAFISGGFEKERIVEVIANVDQVTALVIRVRKANEAQKEVERVETSKTLNSALNTLETKLRTLKHGEYLRAAMVLPRIAAIQSRWTAFTFLDNIEVQREQFVIEEGNWLASQRRVSGARDPAAMTLGDIIANFEDHIVGVDTYLSSLSSPCSPIWHGYLTVDATETDDALTIRKVGVSQIRRKVEQIDSLSNNNVDVVLRFEANPLIQPTMLEWDHHVKSLATPVTWKKPIEGKRLEYELKRLHDKVFGCEGKTEAISRQRLAEAVPPLIDPRTGKHRHRNAAYNLRPT